MTSPLEPTDNDLPDVCASCGLTLDAFGLCDNRECAEYDEPEDEEGEEEEEDVDLDDEDDEADESVT